MRAAILKVKSGISAAECSSYGGLYQKKIVMRTVRR